MCTSTHIVQDSRAIVHRTSMYGVPCTQYHSTSTLYLVCTDVLGTIMYCVRCTCTRYYCSTYIYLYVLCTMYYMYYVYIVCVYIHRRWDIRVRCTLTSLCPARTATRGTMYIVILPCTMLYVCTRAVHVCTSLCTRTSIIE